MRKTKKIRIIWKEHMNGLSIPANETIIPNISFDGGISWITLDGEAAEARRNYNPQESSYYMSTDVEDGFIQVELAASMAPIPIPEISEIIVTQTQSTTPGAFPPGTHFFTCQIETHDTPGSEENPKKVYTTGPLSKVKSIVLTEYSTIDLQIRYPEYSKGIVVYHGTGELTNDEPGLDANLLLITNLTNLLKEDLAIDGQEIILKHKFPFPSSGIVKINNEYISYNACLKTSDGFKLRISPQGRDIRETMKGNLIIHKAGVQVHLASLSGGKYGELPEKVYPYINYPKSLTSYLHFNSSPNADNTVSLINAISSASTPIKKGSNFTYTTEKGMSGSCIKFNGSHIIDPQMSLNDKSGSIHFYLMLYENLIDTNPYIFGSEDGLWARLFKENGCLEVGYKTKILLSHNDLRSMNFQLNQWYSLGFSWTVDSDNNLLLFSIYQDGNLDITNTYNLEESENSILSEWILGSPYWGGLKTLQLDTSTGFNFKDTLSFYLDDVRYYDVYYDEIMFKSIDTELRNNADSYTGKLSLHYVPDSSDIFYPNTDIDKYDPSYNKIIKVKKEGGFNYNVTIDTSLIKSDGNVSDNSKFVYPIEADSVKLKFDIRGTNQVTPYIKDVMVIVSDIIIN